MRQISSQDQLRISFFRQYPWCSQEEFERYKKTNPYRAELFGLELRALINLINKDIKKCILKIMNRINKLFRKKL
jgi:hypothetical protein